LNNHELCQKDGCDPTLEVARGTRDDTGDLIADLQARVPRAMETLYDLYARRAFGLAYRVLGNGDAAEDAVQEAFITLWNQVDRLDGRRGQVGSLLMTIVQRRSIDMLRKQRGMASRMYPLEPDTIDLAADDVLDAVANKLTYDAVRTALAVLPAEQRAVIELAYFEGMTQAEIAVQTSIPIGTVKSRLRLGLSRLRIELGVGFAG
jgi:RNA polymerase sigma-70 factor (ECF subfamily)